MERFKHTQRLAAGTQAQDSSKLAHSADPLARVDGVADPVQPKVRGAEIGVGTKDGKTKKTGASVSADAPVGDQGLKKFPVDTAAWVGHQLLDFKLIFGHY